MLLILSQPNLILAGDGAKTRRLHSASVQKLQQSLRVLDESELVAPQALFSASERAIFSKSRCRIRQTSGLRSESF
ncbi:hypothetical protein OIDMADRAFT_21068 [Oidiodendron maius Zn]|uniref:Uncharacterized protein n=1 Tax=Oidiodendron maius (strain Zn) TaxID=913774 RepID=A0A0C3GV77_OIDMZ|nr:hypothetical protein OIDMADRAFT_21068 [Oidiodendron maius Zn]